MAEKSEHPVANEVGGGLVPGDEEHEDVGDDFVGTDAGPVHLLFDQHRQHVVARSAPAQRDLVVEVLLEFRNGLVHVDARLCRDGGIHYMRDAFGQRPAEGLIGHGEAE